MNRHSCFYSTTALFLVVVPLAILMVAPVAGAATLYVRSTDGVDFFNDCLSESTPCETIGRALANKQAGDLILIAGSFAESLTVDSTLTIEGRSASTLFGQSFNTCVGEALINGCPVWRPSSGGGRSLTSDPGSAGTVILRSVRFSDATQGAIFADTGDLVVEDSFFRDQQGSAAIFSSNASFTVADITIRNTLFEGNSNGAIFSAGTLVVENSTFRLNSRSGGVGGGAISVGTGTAGSSIDVSNSLFEQNFAERGGAISLLNTFATIHGTFRNNSVSGTSGFQGRGGAIYSTDSSLNVSPGTLFENNQAVAFGTLNSTAGGAVYATFGGVRIDGATFRANSIDLTPFAGLEGTLDGCGSSLCIIRSAGTVENSIFEDSVSLVAPGWEDVAPGAIGVVDSDLDLVRSSVLRTTGNGIRIRNSFSVSPAQVEVIESTIAESSEAGIYAAGQNAGPQLTRLNASTLARNQFGLVTGTFVADAAPSVEIRNSTLSGSTGQNLRLSNQTTLTSIFSTFADGTAIETYTSFGTDGSLAFQDSIVNGECVYSSTLLPAFVFGTVWDESSCAASGSGLFADLGLSPLLPVGGPTETHLLSATSPAREAGSLRCLASPIDGLDQRGQSRPESTFCDVGAVEAPEPAFAIGLFVGMGALAGAGRRRGRSSARPVRSLRPGKGRFPAGGTLVVGNLDLGGRENAA